MIISEQKTLNIDQNRIIFLSMGLHIQKKMNYHILEVYTVGSLQICSHNKDCNVQGRKITMLQSIYQKKSPTAIDSVSSRFPTPLLPSNPTQLPCRVFHSASVFSPYSVFPNQHPCSTHQPPL